MAGSATTFTKKNPSFSLVEIDEEFMIPLNFKTYFFNISNAELNPSSAKWEYLHDMVDHYNMQDLSPDSIFRDLALRVRDDESVALKYLWNKVKQSAVKVPRSCD